MKKKIMLSNTWNNEFKLNSVEHIASCARELTAQHLTVLIRVYTTKRVYLGRYNFNTKKFSPEMQYDAFVNHECDVIGWSLGDVPPGVIKNEYPQFGDWGDCYNL